MLQNLPVEVVEQIANFVDEQGILNLRRCCRQLCRKTWARFGTAFFSSLSLSFCPVPFDRLQLIANDETLRHFVGTLRVGEICRRCHNPPGHPVGFGQQWPREAAGCLDVSAPVVTTFRGLITEKLVDCQAISVTDECGDYPERDGTDTSLSTTDAVYLLLYAGSGLRLKSFRINFKRMQPLMNPHQLPRSVLDSAAFSESWATWLKDLRLCWYLRQDDLFPVAVDLVTKARELRSLQLDWSLSDVSSAFLQQLTETPALPAITHIRLQALKGLTPEILCRFLDRFRTTLKCLEIYSVSISSGEWSTVFSRLAHSLARLECVSFLLLSQTPGRTRWLFCPVLNWPGVPSDGSIEFTEALRGLRYRVVGVRYRGRGAAMRTILEGLAETAYRERFLGTTADGTEAGRFPDGVVIAGKLRAKKVTKFRELDMELWVD